MNSFLPAKRYFSTTLIRAKRGKIRRFLNRVGEQEMMIDRIFNKDAGTWQTNLAGKNVPDYQMEYYNYNPVLAQRDQNRNMTKYSNNERRDVLGSFIHSNSYRLDPYSARCVESLYATVLIIRI